MKEIPQFEDVLQICRTGPSLPEHLGTDLPGEEQFCSPLLLPIIYERELRRHVGHLTSREADSFLSVFADLRPTLTYYVQGLGIHTYNGVHTVYGAGSAGTSKAHRKDRHKFFANLGIATPKIDDAHVGLRLNEPKKPDDRNNQPSQVHRLAFASFSDESLAQGALEALLRIKEGAGFGPILFGKSDFTLRSDT